MHFNEQVYQQAVNFLQTCTNSTSISNVSADMLKSVIQKWQNSGHAKYQIIGDNVDMLIKIKHQSNMKPNKSIYWFHMNAVKDRVIASDLSDDKLIDSVCDLQQGDLLPSAGDNQDLLHDFIPLFARIIIDRILAFIVFKDVVIQHIAHKYSVVMKDKSEQVQI